MPPLAPQLCSGLGVFVRPDFSRKGCAFFVRMVDFVSKMNPQILTCVQDKGTRETESFFIFSHCPRSQLL